MKKIKNLIIYIGDKKNKMMKNNENEFDENH